MSDTHQMLVPVVSPPTHQCQARQRVSILPSVWLVVCLLLPLGAVGMIDILDVPTPLDAEYDLCWTQQGIPLGATPLLLRGEAVTPQAGYTLRLTARNATLQVHGPAAIAGKVTSPLALSRHTAMMLTLKRRDGLLGLFVDHRLLLTLPAPAPAMHARLTLTAPPGVRVTAARYRPAVPCRFGDDFMRDEALERALLAGTSWQDDPIWQVAYFHTPFPGSNPMHPVTKAPLLNPWQLTLFPSARTTANAFWFLYTGTGPSWVLAAPTLTPPTWDRYALDAAVKPEFGSEVGLIAAYQDPQNYLLFRLCFPTTDAPPRADLTAFIDGTPHVLASVPHTLTAGQWLQLRLQLDWTHVDALVDGQPLLTAANPGAAEGRIGLYANGVAHPHRPPVDAATAAMYGEDADLNVQSGSCTAFDDVRVEEWHAVPDLFASPYATTKTGTWRATATGQRAATPATLLTGAPHRTSYTVRTRVRLPPDGEGGVLCHLSADRTGYAWHLTPHGQALIPITRGVWGAPLATVPTGVAANTWGTCEVRADGPALTCLLNGVPVLTWDDPTRTAGRCGVYAATAGVEMADVAQRPSQSEVPSALLNPEFARRAFENTWASPSADWYPAVPIETLLLPTELPAIRNGSTPMPTTEPCLYWYKGLCFGDLAVELPLTTAAIAGQALYLAHAYDPDSGYRLQFTRTAGQSTVTLYRQHVLQTMAILPAAPRLQLRLQRHGARLWLTAASPEDDDTDTPLEETVVFDVRDPAPLATEMVGFRVTARQLPAAALTVHATRFQETFERAPIFWRTEGGVWAVMARWTCKPKFNWFGGYGSGRPTAWCKLRLDGDQAVEAYLGVRMQYENVAEEYGQRFRDLNLSFCTDGHTLESGYTVMRATRAFGNPETVLLRRGVVVARTTDPDFLLPAFGQGHNRWFHVRVEKRGGALRVFLDNRLALTYQDPDPLPGGYAALWTHNNGMLLGRVNLSAEWLTRIPAPLPVPTPEPAP